METNQKSKSSSADVLEIPPEPPSYEEIFGTESKSSLDISDTDFLTGVFELKLKQKFKKADGTLKIEIKFNTNNSLLTGRKQNITKGYSSVKFKIEFTFITKQTEQMKLPQAIILTPYLQTIDMKSKENLNQKENLALYSNLKNSLGTSVMRSKSKAAFEPQTIELYNLWIYDPFKKKHICDFEVPLVLKKETSINMDFSKEVSYLVNFDAESRNIKKLLETGFPIKLE